MVKKKNITKQNTAIMNALSTIKRRICKGGYRFFYYFDESNTVTPLKNQ